MLGVSQRRVQQYVQQGRLRIERINDRMFLIPLADVERFERREPGRPHQEKKLEKF